MKDELKKIAAEIEAAHHSEFEEISHFIFTHPELGLEEFESSKHIAEYMKSQGFSVEMPCCGIETAFVATKGVKGPKIAFVAEYDALPGYGPNKENGHACGHNWIAAVTAASAVMLAELCEKKGIDCRVMLAGSPAEETCGAKVNMVEGHVFDDVDLCLQAHLEEKTSTVAKALAMSSITFTYTGKAAHSAAAPWNGINALDSVQLLYAGINALRQHVKPDTRIHGIITEGGQAPNIVPDKASAFFYVRADKRSYANEVIEKVLNVARGAAMMTGAELDIKFEDNPYDDYVQLPILRELMEENLRANGVEPTATEEYAKSRAGSSDIGNVSHACPTMYIEVSTETEPAFSAHEEVCLTLADSPAAYKKIQQIACAMVGVAIDALDNPEIFEIAKRQLAERI